MPRPPSLDALHDFDLAVAALADQALGLDAQEEWDLARAAANAASAQAIAEDGALVYYSATVTPAAHASAMAEIAAESLYAAESNAASTDATDDYNTAMGDLITDMAAADRQEREDQATTDDHQAASAASHEAAFTVAMESSTDGAWYGYRVNRHNLEAGFQERLDDAAAAMQVTALDISIQQQEQIELLDIRAEFAESRAEAGAYAALMTQRVSLQQSLIAAEKAQSDAVADHDLTHFEHLKPKSAVPWLRKIPLAWSYEVDTQYGVSRIQVGISSGQIVDMAGGFANGVLAGIPQQLAGYTGMETDLIDTRTPEFMVGHIAGSITLAVLSSAIAADCMSGALGYLVEALDVAGAGLAVFDTGLHLWEITAKGADFDLFRFSMNVMSAIPLIGFVQGSMNRACFAAGTPIVTSLEGDARLIEDLQVGDLVLSRNEHDVNAPLVLRRIEEKFTLVSPIQELSVCGRVIRTTAEHPFFVERLQKFVPAAQIEVGEQFISHDGQVVTLESSVMTDKVNMVYNFRVAEDHTYFVGAEDWGFSVWVHNSYTGPEQALASAEEVAALRGLEHQAVDARQAVAHTRTNGGRRVYRVNYTQEQLLDPAFNPAVAAEHVESGIRGTGVALGDRLAHRPAILATADGQPGVSGSFTYHAEGKASLRVVGQMQEQGISGGTMRMWIDTPQGPCVDFCRGPGGLQTVSDRTGMTVQAYYRDSSGVVQRLTYTSMGGRSG